jgi:hypothetical protein
MPLNPGGRTCRDCGLREQKLLFGSVLERYFFRETLASAAQSSRDRETLNLEQLGHSPDSTT